MSHVRHDANRRCPVKAESAPLEGRAESNLSEEHFSELGGAVKRVDFRGELGLKI